MQGVPTLITKLSAFRWEPERRTRLSGRPG